ncbi:MAG: hypothetical protein AVDCRST_MAG19-2937 [uncultured Thermomicrobiales bacterium]|uniref:Uncharacterized protein n=1 Tax=uncultured Thermomicrobiales bacterium TaxID=1645740 RepID=A0A6J4V9E0_9BACT|nr:MAG: hypothetical protein AVDCRST_MAG19-2937 [uncultured Thermomicrobiales bacterium]
MIEQVSRPSAGLRDYNYAHFRTKHFVADLARSVRGDGVPPGAEAPDFELPAATGEWVRLSALRGGPVVLHFGSGT